MSEKQYDNVVAKFFRSVFGSEDDSTPQPMSIEEFAESNNLKILSLEEYSEQFGQKDNTVRPAVLSWDQYVEQFGPESPSLESIIAAEIAAIQPSLDRLSENSPGLGAALRGLPDISVLRADVVRSSSVDLSRDNGDAIRQAQLWIREMAKLDADFASKLTEGGVNTTARSWVDGSGGVRTATAIKIAKDHYQGVVDGAEIDVTTAEVDANTLSLMVAVGNKLVTKGLPRDTRSQAEALLQEANARAQETYDKAVASFREKTEALRPDYAEYLDDYREQEALWHEADAAANTQLRQEHSAYVVRGQTQLRELYDDYRNDFVQRVEADQARERNKPLAERDPDLAKSLPIIAGVTVLGLATVVTRRSVRRANLNAASYAEGLDEAIASFHTAVKKGDYTVAQRHGLTARELGIKFGAAGDVVPRVLPTAAAGCAGADGIVAVAIASDYYGSLPGSELRNAVKESLDPTDSEIWGRMVTSCIIGAGGAEVGHLLAKSNLGVKGGLFRPARLAAEDHTAEIEAIETYLRGDTRMVKNIGKVDAAARALEVDVPSVVRVTHPQLGPTPN